MKYLIYTLILTISCHYLSFGQQRVNKPTQTLKTGKNVGVDINTSNVNIEIDTWNKNYIEIDAGIESEKLTKEELQDVLDAWDLDIDFTGNNVRITSHENMESITSNINFINGETSNLLKDLEIDISNIALIELDNFDFNIIESSEFPELPEMPELPELNNDSYNFSFDVKKYKKQGESYLKKWSKNFESKFGEVYQKEMEVWAKKMSELDLDSYQLKVEQLSNKKERLQEKLEEHKELRQQAIEKSIEVRQEARERRSELLNVRKEKMEQIRLRHNKDKHNNISIYRTGSKANKNIIKTIKIKLPKKAKINLNVKHGELILSSVITDLKADLAYGNLKANRINGGKTFINTSYSNVSVNHWSNGGLKLNHVENATINTVDNLVLSANSSHIIIGNILDSGLINHRFGDLTIKGLASTFTDLDITLKGSDTLLKLPENSYNLIFKGEQSKFNNERTNKIMIDKNGQDLTNNITINAKYSNVFTN